ncbi:sigma-54-dependent transcriptional regulator [Flavihumibacter petaseus]|uniref:Putative two-component response regulator n=1 Tax=Flavihumibacter petaseus NBRC 106054 TaxID=1220578 RepID=A0A0E9MWT1_9BACT|nr:sigma-54 dependent transcriptional regulator [Flavihumibacter petaseus]GAO41575.1 putative two-component response regulator [Flavihumibacter petaseus NBRC 106054]
MKRILIIDDDPDICFLVERLLQHQGHETFSVNHPRKALQQLEKTAYDLVITDFRLESMDGNELMARIRSKYPIPVIVISGYNNVRKAVESIRGGAYDFILKPIEADQLLTVVESALAAPPPAISPDSAAPVSTGQAAPELAGFSSGHYLVGESETFRKIMQQIKLVASTDYSVILYGESGTGKEAIAREIHQSSGRKQFPFVAIDCGALSNELAGSELFGHEKGAFTGAVGQKTGSFEAASGGTIFLDEVANLSYSIQVSLLRVLQERKIRPVGGMREIEIDVRIIVASNERLWAKCRNGTFREDLFHRLNEFNIEIPPLRDRKGDIPLFARHFLKLANSELNKNILGFSEDALGTLVHYDWPGNLRELQNVVKRSALLSENEWVTADALPQEITNPGLRQPILEQEQSIPAKARTESPPPEKYRSLKLSSIDYEYELIQKTLRDNNNNKSKAARILNIDRKTLYNKIALYEELLRRRATGDEPS